jgi:hypothetical protein
MVFYLRSSLNVSWFSAQAHEILYVSSTGVSILMGSPPHDLALCHFNGPEDTSHLVTRKFEHFWKPIAHSAFKQSSFLFAVDFLI